MNKFWGWYERNYTLNVGLAAGLFVLQLVHLYWLTADVVALRLISQSFFSAPPLWEIIIILVDYAEIPAIIAVSLIYLNELRSGVKTRALLYLFFINSQWLHIFWITDEFVIARLTGAPEATVLPVWLAWAALAIDYLELPVIFDTTKRFFKNILRGAS